MESRSVGRHEADVLLRGSCARLLLLMSFTLEELLVGVARLRILALVAVRTSG
jgi:hypothetical protein